MREPAPAGAHPTSRRPRRAWLAALAAAALLGLGVPMLSAPTGATPATDGNPDLGASCGLDVTLVLDDSGSIDGTEAQQVRDGAQAVASALVGTGSRLKTAVFDTRATGVSSGGSLTSVVGNIAFRDPAAYTAPTSGAGQGGTNWDDGLEVVRRSPGGAGDLLVFLTDGDPTYRNTTTPNGHSDAGNQSISGTGNTVDAANVANAVTEADLIKASGTHMFGIGIGLTAPASEQRLNDVTGDEEMTIAGGTPTPGFDTADYIVAPNFSQLQGIINTFVSELCGHSLNITKYLQKADGTTVKAGAADPWEMTATLDPAPDTWENPSGVVGSTGSLVTDDNGVASFVWDTGGPSDSHQTDLVETPRTGWVYNGATCSVNDFSGAPPTELFDTVGPNVAGSTGDPSDLNDLTVASETAVNCAIYNREVRTSTVQVTKTTAPAGLPGDFTFALRQGPTTIDTVSGISHGETGTFAPVGPGTYAVVETGVAPGFTAGSVVCDDLTTPAVEAVSGAALVVGEGQSWRCGITNTASPGSITVHKVAHGADGTFGFTSNVPGLGAFSITTSGGTGSSATVPAPVGHYNLAESTPAGWSLDSATCTGGDSPSDIAVGPGEAVVCTFTNTAPDPSIRVVKSAGTPSVLELGAPVTFTVSVVNTSVEPVTVSEITDSIDGGPSLDLTTTGGPITATTCGALVGDVLAVGATGTCTFVAQVAGLGNTSEVDEVTVAAVDSDDNLAVDSDTASVDIVGVLPSLSVTKTPSPVSLTEPGGLVTYTVAITNTGVEPVTVSSLKDSMEGEPPVDITQVAGPITATTCNGLVGSSVAVGATVSCTFTYLHTGHTASVPDGFIDDTVTIVGTDDDGQVTATASAKVALLDAPPAVTVTKDASPSSVAETAPGQTRTVTYSVTITNDAPEAATIEAITDSVEGTPPVAVLGTCDELVGDSLAAGASVSCAFTRQVAGAAGDILDDEVAATLSDDEGGTATDSDPASVTFTNVASSLAVTKTAGVTSVPENGGAVTYTVDITNTSATDSVTLGALVDSVDGGPAFPLAGTCAALVGDVLVPGGSVSCTFTLPVTGNAGDVVADVVTVTGTDDDGGPVSDTGEDSVTITDRPSSLAVTKVADVDALPEPGGPVTYTVSITNTSAADSITLDSITDAVNGGVPADVAGTCDDLIGVVLAPNQTRTCTFTATVGTHTGDVTTDVVVVGGTDDDDRPVSGQGSEAVSIIDIESSISVVKEAGVASVPEPGGPVPYTVTIRNTSPVDTITITSVTDAVGGGAPAAVDGTCDDLIGTALAPSEEVQCEFTDTVSGNAGDVVTDTVTVAYVDDEQFQGQGSATDTVDITDVAPSLIVEKTASPTSVPETAPGATAPVTYSVTINNTSVEPVTLTSIVDAVGGGAPGAVAGTCDDLIGTSLAPDDSVSCTFTGAVAGDAGTSVTDVVTVGATDDEQNPASASDDASVTFTDVGSSVAVTKTANVDTVPEPGAPVTYTVSITNTSLTDPITLDSLTDAVDGGTAFPLNGACGDLVGDVLQPGQNVTCTFTQMVSGAPGATVRDTVVVQGTDDDGAPVSDEGSEAVGVTDVASSLAVTKVADVTTVPEPGADVTYTVTITNTSVTDSVTLSSITDSVGGAPATDVAGSCDDLLGKVLAPSASTTCTFTVAVTGNAGDTVADTVVVGGTDDDQQPVSGQGSETVDVGNVTPTISVTKTASPSSAPETGPGEARTITYTVSVVNDSPETVTIDSITDSVQGAPATDVAGTCDDLIGTTLAPQASVTCTFTADVAGDAGATVSDVVTVTVSDDEESQGSDNDDATVTLTDQPSSLLVEKTAGVGSVPEPGADVTYTVKITNTSPADSVTLGSITDSVQGAPATDVAGTCDDLIGTTLAVGASVECTFTVAVAGNAGDTVGDTVVVGGTDDDQQPVSGQGSETVAVTDVPSSLSVTKSADPGSVPEDGGPVTYTVTITNTSPADSVTIDAITDSVDGGPGAPAGGTCADLVGDVLTPGQVVTCTFTLDVHGGAGDVIGDTVVVDGTDDDDGPVSGQGSEVVDITDVSSSLAVTKSADADSVPEPGRDVTYTLEITNTSTTDSITLDSMVDSVDGGAPQAVAGTCADLVGDVLTPGQKVTCTFTSAVGGNAGDAVADTVTVTGTDDDGGPVSAQGSDVVDITDVPPTGTVVKTGDVASVPESGGSVVYTVSVTNDSAVESATVTSLSDVVDGTPVDITTVGGPVTATTCATGTVLAPGATYTCTFTYAVAPGTADDVVADTVTVGLADDDGNEVTPSDGESVTLTDVAPSLTVDKVSEDPTLVAPGGEADFHITVTNTSWESVILTSLTDSVDGGTPFDITTVADPVLATDCALGGTIAAGGSYSCTFTLLVSSDEAASVPDEVVAGVVDDDDTEATAADTAVTTVTASADLSVDKVLQSEELVPGESGSYGLIVANDGPSTAVGVSVVDTLPAGLTATGASGEGWTCTVEAASVTCERPELAPGTSSTVTVAVDVAESTAGTSVTNVAEVGSDTDDPDLTNNVDEQTDAVAATQNEEEEKPPPPGGPIGEVLARTGLTSPMLFVVGLGLIATGGLVLRSRRLRLVRR